MLPRMIAAIVVSCVALAAAAVLLLSGSRVLETAGLVVLAALAVASSVSDWYLARSNEKHVARYPHLLRNEAIGATVRVSGDFEVTDGVARGLVILRGEQWKARCVEGYVPKDGDTMSVRGREGLTLYVQRLDLRE